MGRAQLSRMKRTHFIGGLVALGSCGAARASAASAEIPFTFAGGSIVVPVRVGAATLRMVFDTGNSFFAVDSAAIAEAGIAVAKPAAGASYTRFSLAASSFGGVPFGAAPALSAEMRGDLKKSLGVEADGSLGYRYFANRIVQIDYPNRVLRLLDAAPQDGTRTPITWLQYTERSPKLVTFDGLEIGGVALPAQFDTYFTRTAIVFSSKTPGLTLGPSDVKPIRYEEADLPARSVNPIRFKGMTLKQNVVFEAGPNAHVPTTALAAVAGNELFADRVVTLDYQTSTLIVG